MILCLVTVFGLSVPGLASAENTVEEAVLLSSKYSLMTEFSSIKESANGEYAMTTDSADVLLPVGRLDIELDNEEQVNMVLAMDNLGDETKQYIQMLSEKAQNEPESAGLVATLFSQDILPQTRATTYYTYNGLSMKNDIVYIVNNPSGYQFINVGTGAKAFAQTVSQILMYAGGYLTSSISIGGTLLSIFEAWAGGNVSTASTSDFTQMEITYTGSYQWTYVLVPGTTAWQMSYFSQNITVTQVEIYQKFNVNGSFKTQNTFLYPYATVKSPGFDSPWSTAYTYYFLTPLYEYVSLKVGNMTWYFD